MTTCAIVASRGEDIERYCLIRNLGTYAHLFDEIIIVSPCDSVAVVPGYRVIAQGESGHSGKESLERFKLALTLGAETKHDLVAFTEYDGLFLKTPQYFEGVQTTIHRDSDIKRWGVNFYCHPPIIFSKQALKLFTWKMTDSPYCEGYGDRWFAAQIHRMGLPILDLGATGEGFSRNTIDERYVGELKSALQNGAWALHGVKDRSVWEVCLKEGKMG